MIVSQDQDTISAITDGSLRAPGQQPVFISSHSAIDATTAAARAHDSALVTASAEMKWLNGFSLAGTFEGEFSNVTTSYAGKGVVRYAW